MTWVSGGSVSSLGNVAIVPRCRAGVKLREGPATAHAEPSLQLVSEVSCRDSSKTTADAPDSVLVQTKQRRGALLVRASPGQAAAPPGEDQRIGRSTCWCSWGLSSVPVWPSQGLVGVLTPGPETPPWMAGRPLLLGSAPGPTLKQAGLRVLTQGGQPCRLLGWAPSSQTIEGPQVNTSASPVAFRAETVPLWLCLGESKPAYF